MENANGYIDMMKALRTRKTRKQMTTLGHRYELHHTNTHDTDEHGHRYTWCVYDYFDVNGQDSVSFWYFTTKQEALRQYPIKNLAPTLTKNLEAVKECLENDLKE